MERIIAPSENESARSQAGVGTSQQAYYSGSLLKMARFGDPSGIWPGHGFSAMPTALLVAYTAAGYFIGADGRSRLEDGGPLVVFSDTEQKIFPIMDERACFAFALTGTSRFTPDDNDSDLIFDFRTEPQRVAATLSQFRFSDAGAYCEELARRVNIALGTAVENARAIGKPVTYPEAGICLMVLCGYYAGVPFGITYGFTHREQKLVSPFVQRTFHLIGEKQMYGSPAVDNLLVSGDPRFARFRPSFQNPSHPTFVELAEQTVDYVAACETDIAQSIDPEHAPGIGGRVHAAAVTPDSKFTWVAGFEPA
jgi:hypothetical protein